MTDYKIKIDNKGTGAGGSKTNETGLPYENFTDLKDKYYVISKIVNGEKIKFMNHECEYIKTSKSDFFKYMDKFIDKNIVKGHGCKQPDECYINEIGKIIFIIEKKFQQTGGSVCEKIQTCEFKTWQYTRTFPGWRIVYIYCLSDWFIKNCVAEIEYLNYKKLPIFWGNSLSYKEDVIKFIINYK